VLVGRFIRKDRQNRTPASLGNLVLAIKHRLLRLNQHNLLELDEDNDLGLSIVNAIVEEVFDG
jgi:hypothetical protein